MRVRILLLFVLGALSACSAAAPSPATQTAPATEPCRLQAPGAVEQIAAECATLLVPADYSQPAGATISLSLAVLPAIGRTAVTDPLVLLAGGPGQAAIESFTPLLRSLSAINQTRDILLVDQRGTGDSTPLLCALDSLPTDDADDAAYLEWVAACAEDQPVDPRLFSTEASARDLDTVRAALGYGQLNLLGVSYGTRLAQTYAQLFPERTRSLILDGVVPQDVPIGSTMAADGQRALDRMFARCAEDAACAATFPMVAQDFAGLLRDLEAEPVAVTLADPFTGQPTTRILTRELAALTVQTLSYAPETTALLPLLISTAAAGDLRPLTAQTLLVERGLAESIALGLRFSVVCGEDVPFFPAVSDATESYLGTLMTEALAAPCEVWPHTVGDQNARQPLNSAVPTLLLSGENDPVTPPAYAEAVAASLPNSRHIVAAGQGHNVFFRGCIPAVMADFLETTSPAELDLACVERIGAPPFFLSFSGP